MSVRIDNICEALSKTAESAAAAFADLSGVQLNWKPGEKSWSIGQCFEHLITTHSLYFPLLERLASGEKHVTFLERYSPLSSFFGRYLINAMRPENPKKMKTTSRGFPAESEIAGDIVERYVGHQNTLIRHIREIPRDLDGSKKIITSPLLGLITYSLDDMYTIFVVHGQRHLQQAGRVAGLPEFPRAAARPTSGEQFAIS